MAAYRGLTNPTIEARRRVDSRDKPGHHVGGHAKFKMKCPSRIAACAARCTAYTESFAKVALPSFFVKSRAAPRIFSARSIKARNPHASFAIELFVVSVEAQSS
jgi:hypothetical protein